VQEGKIPARAVPDPGQGIHRMRLVPSGALAAAAPHLLLALEREEPGGDWSARRISGPRTAIVHFALVDAPLFVAMAEGLREQGATTSLSNGSGGR
jgi:hypothetical protein